MNEDIEKIQEHDKTDFQKFLLSAPVMDDEQYKTYLANREKMIQWRTKSKI